MRILGYAMLVIGFVWICFWQFGMWPIRDHVIVSNYDKIPKQQSYKSEDIQKAVRDVGVDFYNQSPSFYIGALLMLGGGVVLDIAGRRKRV
jgi:hypothetical protein